MSLSIYCILLIFAVGLVLSFEENSSSCDATTNNNDSQCTSNSNASVSSSASAEHSVKIESSPDHLDCPLYGCPFEPLDAIFDRRTNRALNALRTEKQDQKGTRIRKKPWQLFSQLGPLLSAGGSDFSTLSLKGKTDGSTHQDNQDLSFIYSPFQVVGRSANKAQLLGVMDGHGTDALLVAQHVARELPRILAEELSQRSNATLALHETFRRVDATEPSQGTSGTTASVILQLDNTLYIANVGTSVSFVGVNIGEHIEVVYQSQRNTPDIPEERHRIEASGGRVLVSPGDLPRACVPTDSGLCRHAIPMSRSIGDGEVPGIISTPVIDVIDIDELIARAVSSYTATFCVDPAQTTCHSYSSKDAKLVAVAATDGFLEFPERLDVTDVCHAFAASYYVPDNPHPHTASEYLLLEAAHLWEEATKGDYRDDMVVASMKVWS